MDEQNAKQSKEREKMLADGTVVSSVKVRVVEPAPTTIETSSPAPKEGEVPEIPIPKGLELVEEPYIVSTAGQLSIEPRMVSTGGVLHPEAIPVSFTPSLPGNALPPEGEGGAEADAAKVDPEVKVKTETKADPKTEAKGKAKTEGKIHVPGAS